MRIRTYLATAIAVAAVLGGTAAPAHAKDPTIYVCTDDTNIRNLPSTKADIVGTCWKGQRVPVKCYGPGQKINGNPVWYWLDRPNKTYWIHSSLAIPRNPGKVVGRC